MDQKYEERDKEEGRTGIAQQRWTSRGGTARRDVGEEKGMRTGITDKAKGRIQIMLWRRDRGVRWQKRREALTECFTPPVEYDFPCRSLRADNLQHSPSV